MIPLRDVIPSRTTPWITIAFAALNALAWAYEVALPQESLPAFLRRYGLIPAEVAPAALVTAPFLHGSWLQAVANVWCLWIFGDNVEAAMGHARFAALYVLCGAAALLGHAALAPASAAPAVGASGAIAGVAGAYVVLFPHSRVLALVPLVVSYEIVELSAALLLGFWLILQLFSIGGLAVAAHGATGIAFAAHGVGFALGVIGALGFRRGWRWDEEGRART
jgi:membrane associated rhomboid family serine protease